MRRHRIRQKENGLAVTRSEKKEQQRKWREYKKNQLAKMTKETKEHMRILRHERYVKKKMDSGKKFAVPESPRKFARLMATIIKNASSSQKAALLDEGIVYSQQRADEVKICASLSDTFQKLKKSRKDADRRVLKHLVRATNRKDVAVYKLMGIRYIYYYLNCKSYKNMHTL